MIYNFLKDKKILVLMIEIYNEDYIN